MSDPECTAVVADGEPPPNPLFTPPCTCPDCAPDRRYHGDGRPDRNWLRLAGDKRRHRVRPVTLGPRGRAMLG
ncbi:MAG: hypothetical protein AAF547_13010 [Actinomycetota bacterium]